MLHWKNRYSELSPYLPDIDAYKISKWVNVISSKHHSNICDTNILYSDTLLQLLMIASHVVP